jgi:hypothetical protein
MPYLPFFLLQQVQQKETSKDQQVVRPTSGVRQYASQQNRLSQSQLRIFARLRSPICLIRPHPKYNVNSDDDIGDFMTNGYYSNNSIEDDNSPDEEAQEDQNDIPVHILFLGYQLNTKIAHWMTNGGHSVLNIPSLRFSHSTIHQNLILSMAMQTTCTSRQWNHWTMMIFFSKPSSVA